MMAGIGARTANATCKIAQQKRIGIFHDLHRNNLLFMPNAWDCVSAKIFQEEGASAIGTTSAGLAGVLGYADGQQIPKQLFLQTVQAIVSSVTIPVSVDLEAGYGSTTEEICDTVRKVIETGAVGINIEDTDPNTNELLPLKTQIERIVNIRKTIDESNLKVFINARTDVYWSGQISDDKKYQECETRLTAYKDAGAHGVFVPGLTDIGLITKICNHIQLPLNVLGGGWITPVIADQLRSVGVGRVSAGSGLFRSAVTATQEKYRQFCKGDLSFLKDCLTYDQINNMFK